VGSSGFNQQIVIIFLAVIKRRWRRNA